MSEFKFVVEVAAPPFHVWETLLDIERWPQWTRTVTTAQRLDEGPLAVGSRTRLLQPKLLPAIWTVTELDPRQRLFTWTTGRPGIHIAGSHLVDRTDEGSRVTLSLTYSGLFGWLMARQLKRLNWDYLTAEAQGLKARCESTLAPV
jgi:uncharacterized membrane protein